MPRRRIFISYDDADIERVRAFMALRSLVEGVEFYDHHADRRICDHIRDDEEPRTRQLIREHYIRPATVTVILIGVRTAHDDRVQWEIGESRAQGNGLLGIKLVARALRVPDGIPDEAVGPWQADQFIEWIEWAHTRRLSAVMR